MKKLFCWIGGLLLSPILIFLLLAALLYVPPVQNWVAQKVVAITSEKTGMNITVERVALKWPLNLALENFRALKQNDSLPQLKDTIADVRLLVADVRLWPLLKKRVVINELSLNQARINTDGLISDLRIKGHIHELWLASRGIDLEQETVEVNGARLKDANLFISLSDTAAVDTTQSVVKWQINADSISICRTNISIDLPGDTLHAEAYLGMTVAKNADIDLGAKTYSIGSIDWTEGQLSYDNRKKASITGFDYNHIALDDLNLGIDSISYTPSGISLSVRSTTMREKSGLEIRKLHGRVYADSTFSRIQLPGMTLSTADSDIYTEADINLGTAEKQQTSPIVVRLNAQIGKQDLARFAGNLPQKFIQQYPDHPLSIKGSVNGSTEHLDFTGLDITLPTALHLSASGTARNLTNIEELQADVTFNAKFQDLNFVMALFDSKTASNYRIPSNMTLAGHVLADRKKYTADVSASDGKGQVKGKGSIDTATMAYQANITVSDLNLHHFMPKDSLYGISADVHLQGRGTDILNPSSHMKAEATISQLQYGYLNLDDIAVSATLKNGWGQATLTGHNRLFDGSVAVNALLDKKRVEATVDADLQRADLYRMRLVNDTLAIGLKGTMEVSSDLRQTHHIKGLVSSIYIEDKKQTYHPENLGIFAQTSPDTTLARLQSGDFIAKLDASGGYEHLMKQGQALMDSARMQYERKIIDQIQLKQMLPSGHLYLTSGRDNPMANILRSNGVDFKQLFVDLTTSPETGINGSGHLYSLNIDSIRIDTVMFNLVQKGERLTYNAQIRNNRRNPQFVFNALLDGHFHEHGAVTGLRYYDADNKLGVRLGATAEMEDNGIRFHLMPSNPTIGYKLFTLNDDNYLFLNAKNKVQAKIDLIADDHTGLKIYTEDQDSLMLQDLTVSLNRINLEELTSVLPYVPRMSGYLGGDFHIVQDQDERFSVVSDMAIQSMTYEGSPIGNLSTELVYLQREDEAHAIEARLMLDDEEFGLLTGSYKSATKTEKNDKKNDDEIDATFTMTRLPLSLANGFVPDQLLGLDGFAEGSVSIKGSTQHPLVDGEVYLDSAYLVSVPYGVRMRFDNDPVRIVGSHLLFENFGLYAYNDQPFVLMGDIDFSDTEKIKMDMRMRAQNLLLIDARQTAASVAFGKAYVNFFARLQGPVESLSMRGKLDVLGSTDLTYMLLDSPLSTDNRLEELVKFTDFSDTTQTVINRPAPSGLNVDMDISVSQGAHIVCDLNSEQSNYIDLMGGGDLRMKYSQDGISLTGRYTLSNGEMKYSLPIIPLKTFTIQDGSYVEFTGDPMNPRLNITATERTKASVGDQSGVSRSVAFDCGVVITKTLNDMGLQFIISAPEDNSVNGELQTMSVEERGKLAVTMLTTGMYLADGNTSGFSMNSALSSFLQSEINNITGSALKTLDLTVGLDNTTDASGSMHTDYSFKFAKRLWNNRLKIELGGKVSSGNNDFNQGQQQSFFDNVTMEYRLNQDATQNIKLFYKQNVYDWLEGYTGEYGGGFIWRRKLDSFWDIFTFWRQQQPLTMPTVRPQAQPRDTLTQDSLLHEKR